MGKIVFNDTKCPECQQILSGAEIEIDVEATLKKLGYIGSLTTEETEDGSYRIGQCYNAECAAGKHLYARIHEGKFTGLVNLKFS